MVPFHAEQLVDEIADEMDGFGYMYWTGPDPRPWNDVEDDEDKPGYEETFGVEDGEEGVSARGSVLQICRQLT